MTERVGQGRSPIGTATIGLGVLRPAPVFTKRSENLRMMVERDAASSCTQKDTFTMGDCPQG